ncbi:hypothetical protein JW898_00910 [Candidatus Woesearchaeota archaeon]|nr:hypothetical protein [Candidatus Woesearchaeota archaeon]
MKGAEKNYLTSILLLGNSLHELLGILKGICENLDLDYLDPRIKHFKYFQFTFFGLMVKATSLSKRMLLKAEYLEQNHAEFSEICNRIKEIDLSLKKAFELIKKNKMIEGKNRIVKTANQYEQTFEKIEQLIKIKNIGI